MLKYCNNNELRASCAELGPLGVSHRSVGVVDQPTETLRIFGDGGFRACRRTLRIADRNGYSRPVEWSLLSSDSLRQANSKAYLPYSVRR
jgi:hypothetical protein